MNDVGIIVGIVVTGVICCVAESKWQGYQVRVVKEAKKKEIDERLSVISRSLQGIQDGKLGKYFGSFQKAEKEGECWERTLKYTREEEVELARHARFFKEDLKNIYKNARELVRDEALSKVEGDSLMRMTMYQVCQIYHKYYIEYEREKIEVGRLSKEERLGLITDATLHQPAVFIEVLKKVETLEGIGNGDGDEYFSEIQRLLGEKTYDHDPKKSLAHYEKARELYRRDGADTALVSLVEKHIQKLKIRINNNQKNKEASGE